MRWRKCPFLYQARKHSLRIDASLHNISVIAFYRRFSVLAGQSATNLFPVQTCWRSIEPRRAMCATRLEDSETHTTSSLRNHAIRTGTRRVLLFFFIAVNTDDNNDNEPIVLYTRNDFLKWDSGERGRSLLAPLTRPKSTGPPKYNTQRHRSLCKPVSCYRNCI